MTTGSAEEFSIAKRELGQTGLQVSVIGIGSSPFRHGSAETCAELVTQAFRLGVNYYDTARSYINGEETIGVLPADVRDGLVVTTKTGARGGKRCLSDLQTSLRLMKRRWIDLWMTHMIETEHEYELCTALGGFCDIALAAKRAGLVRATGASFHAHTELIERAIKEKAFDVVMFPLNLVGRETRFGSSIASYRDILLPAAHERGVGVVVMKVLAAGEIRHGSPAIEFLDGEKFDLIGASIRWACLHPEISTAVLGIANTRELVYNALAVQNVRPDRALADAWFSQLHPDRAEECTRCGKCEPVCPQQIQIPKIARLFEQQSRLGIRGFPRHAYESLGRTVSDCTRCGACNEVCPESLDVPLFLLAAHRALTNEERLDG